MDENRKDKVENFRNRLAHMNSTLDELKLEDKKLADELKLEEAELDKKIEEKLRAVFIQ